MKKMLNDNEMLEEYDFTNGIKGKYSNRYEEGTNIVMLDKDVMSYFPNQDSVNQALRSIIPIIEQHDMIGLH